VSNLSLRHRSHSVGLTDVERRALDGNGKDAVRTEIARHPGMAQNLLSCRRPQVGSFASLSRLQLTRAIWRRTSPHRPLVALVATAYEGLACKKDPTMYDYEDRMGANIAVSQGAYAKARDGGPVTTTRRLSHTLPSCSRLTGIAPTKPQRSFGSHNSLGQRTSASRLAGAFS
jgi:hypothetical protein